MSEKPGLMRINNKQKVLTCPPLITYDNSGKKGN